MFTKVFWQDTIERAIRTFVQAAAGLCAGAGIGILDIAWWHVLSVAGMAALVCVLTYIGAPPNLTATTAETAVPADTAETAVPAEPGARYALDDDTDDGEATDA